MKYAHEIIDLMGIHPGIGFRMRHLVRHVNRGLHKSPSAYEAARRGIRRVLQHLIETGQVEKQTGVTNGTTYVWKGESGSFLDENPKKAYQMSQ